MGRQQPRDGEERFSAYLDELAGVMGRVSRVGRGSRGALGLLHAGGCQLGLRNARTTIPAKADG